MIAYLHFSAGPAGPFQTLSTDVRVRPPLLKSRGRYVSTVWQVRLHGRWRRVRCNRLAVLPYLFIGPSRQHLARVQFVPEQGEPQN